MASSGPGAAPGLDYKDYYAVLGVPRTASQADIKKAFRKLARQHHPDAKPGDTAAERRFKEINEANEVLSDPARRKQYDELGANWEAISRARQAGAAGGAGAPFGGFGGYPGGNVRYEFHTTADPGEFSDFFRMFFGEEAMGSAGASPASGGRGSRPTGGLGFDDILSGMGIDGQAARTAQRRRSRPVAPPTHEAQAEITLSEAYHGTTRLVEVDGKRLEIKIPPGADTGTRIKLSKRGPGGGDLIVVVQLTPDRSFVAPRRRSRAGAATDPRGGPPRRRGQGAHAQGQRPAHDPARHPARADVPADRPGHAAVQGRRLRRPVRQGPGRSSRPACPTRRRRPPAPSSTSSTNPTHAEPAPEPISETAMQLDRFTQKAQEAIIAAQATAQRLDSPILDAEHILAALVEPDDGVPAETLRRLGVDLPGFRGELAAILARRARIQGGSLSMDPRARRVIELAEAEAQAARRRVRLDRAPAARRGRGRRRGPGPARGPRGRPGGPPPGAPERARRPARDLAEPRGHLRRAREVRPRPDRRGARRQARPGDRPRRGDPAGHPGPLAAHEEQPGPDRRARRGQDGDRRGPRPADRPRRRPRRAQGQARGVARPRRADRRGQVPRRVRGAAEGRAQGDQGRRGPGDPVHRRAPHGRRGRCGGRGDGRLQPAQADARPRRAAHDRGDDARRVPQAHREGRRPRAALPAGPRRPADGRGDDQHPARAARAVRGPPRRADHRFRARRGGDPVRPLHQRPLPARQGDRPRRRGGVPAAHGDRLDADRDRRARAPAHPARDRARGAAQGVGRRLEGAARGAREGAGRHRGAGRRAAPALGGGEGRDRRDPRHEVRARGADRRGSSRPSARPTTPPPPSSSTGPSRS